MLSGNRRHPWDCQHTEMGSKLCAQSDASVRLERKQMSGGIQGSLVKYKRA